MEQKKYNIEEIKQMFEAYINYRRTGITSHKKIYQEKVPFEIHKKIEEIDEYFRKTLSSRLKEFFNPPLNQKN